MTGHDTRLAGMPTAARPMFAALATGLDTLSMTLAAPVRTGAGPGPLSRLRVRLARLGSWFEDHGDYFAAMERALPPHVRERREARRDHARLMRVAMLSR
jgi:hypothetical protein